MLELPLIVHQYLSVLIQYEVDHRVDHKDKVRDQTFSEALQASFLVVYLPNSLHQACVEVPRQRDSCVDQENRVRKDRTDTS